MKFIVLYTFVFLEGFLPGMNVNAQKPVLDLIPVQRQLPYPETVRDTSGILRELPSVLAVPDSFQHPVPFPDQAEAIVKETRRTEIVPHSFFKKRGDITIGRPARPAGKMFIFKYIHPVRMFLQITAQK